MPGESWKFVLIVFLNPGEENTEKFFRHASFYRAFRLMRKLRDFYLMTAFIKSVLRRTVNARTGGGLSLLKGRAFSTPAAPKK